MRLLARSGRRAEALAQYEACRAVLADELRVEPETETKTKTTQLAGRIRDGELEILPATHARPPTLPPPCFLIEGTDDASLPLFVARDQELARLATFADQALEGTGRVAFVTGGPGQGKSALLGEFVRRAMENSSEKTYSSSLACTCVRHGVEVYSISGWLSVGLNWTLDNESPVVPIVPGPASWPLSKLEYERLH